MRGPGIVDCLPPGGKRKPGWSYPRPFSWLGLPSWKFLLLFAAAGLLSYVLQALLNR